MPTARRGAIPFACRVTRTEAGKRVAGIDVEKTSLLLKIDPTAVRSSVANKGHFTTRSSCDERAPKMIWRYAPKIHDAHLAMRFMIQARIDLLFTMSDIPQTASLVKDLPNAK